MGQELKIQIDDEIFQKLRALCTGDEKKMKEFIKNALKDRIIQKDPSYSPKDSLESYLSNGKSGSRNYGVKGQGW